MAVVPPFWTGPILPLAPLAGRGGFPFITLAFKVIRAIAGRRFFALATEELILEFSVLTAKIFNLGFEVLGPMHGPSVLSFPIPDLLPQFEILTPQIGDFLAQFEQLRDKVAAPAQTNQPARRPKAGSTSVSSMTRTLVPEDLSCDHRPIGSRKTGWAKVYERRPIQLG